MTARKSRRRGVILSSTGQRKLEAARRQHEKTQNQGDRFTLEELSEQTQLALSTVTRVLDAQVGVDRQTLEQFFAAFDLMLERSDYQHPEGGDNAAHLSSANLLATNPPCVVDWGEAIDVSIFYGRTAELSTLEQWIQRDHCRLVALLGIGGIGKTALSVKLAQHLAPPFDFIIWRTLRNAPPLELLLTDLIQVLSRQQESVQSLTTPALLVRLMHYLRQYRCLLILDNGETILQSGQYAGAYRPDYEGYGELLRQVGEISHQSCLVLTSREKPETIASLEGQALPVRSFALHGLPHTESNELFDAIGLLPSPTGRQQLIKNYGGNPLALKIIATSVRDLFDGDVDAFLGEETTVFNGIRRLLDQQCQRLTPLETKVMTWLAVHREWVTLAELQADFVLQVAKQRILETLESLARRNLIEQKNARFTQQPVVMEYMTEQLIEQVCQEIGEIKAVNLEPERLPDAFSAFNAYALIKASAKDYVRESQIRLILQPIARRLREQFRSIAALEQQMLRLLTILRRLETQLSGYGVGNLLNLMVHLQLDLTGYDFSCLTIREADLQNSPLHRVNLSHTHLIACRFAQPVSHPYSLAVSPNGDLIAIGGEDGLIQMWQISTGQMLHTIQAHTTYVFALTFSPDGQTLVSGGMDFGTKFWDVNTGRCLQTWQFTRCWALAFSPDGKLLAESLEDDDRSIHLWDWASKRCLRTFKGHTGPASGLAFATRSINPSVDPCGSGAQQLLISGGQDGLIKIWDVESGDCIQTLTEHTGIIWSVCVHPDGDRFATGSFDHSIKIWDLQTGDCIQTFMGHTGEVTGISFSPDGRLLASASGDRTIRLWEVSIGKCLAVLRGHLDTIWSVAFTRGTNQNGEWAPGQALVSAGFDQTVRFWDISGAVDARAMSSSDDLPSFSGQCTKTIQGDSAGIRSIARHPQENWLVSGGLDKIIRLWDLSGKCFQTFTGHTGSIWKVTFHPQGTILASASFDGEIRIWEVSSGRCLRSIRPGSSWIHVLGFSPQGYLVSGSMSDATIRFWDIQSGECWRSLALEPGGYPLGMDFHPEGRFFVTAGNDGRLCWWDMDTGECFRVRSGKDGHTWGVAFHPQGHLFASIGNDLFVKLWDAESGECLAKLEGHSGIHGSVAFSPDGAFLASGRSDRTIRLWDVATQKCLHVLEGHTGIVTSVLFMVRSLNASGEQQLILASSSYDGSIRLWDVKTGTCLNTFRPARLYEGMNITGVTGLMEGAIATLKSLGAEIVN